MPAITVQRNGHNGGAKRRLVRTREAIADTTTGLLRGERAGEGARAGSLGTRLPWTMCATCCSACFHSDGGRAGTSTASLNQ
jgi:hypothetical protein